jgi:digeranylgeranylglycerophospholipid reductase
LQRNIVDVIVVGAGPAGSTAAAVLAGSGIKTIILERKKIIGIPNHCGEGIAKRALEILGWRESAEWIVKEMRGARFVFPNGRFFFLYEPGYCINRPLFDRECAERAQKKGARLLLQRKVVDIQREKRKWKIVTQTRESYYGTYLVAADGAPSTVRRLLGLSANYIKGIQYKFETIQKLEEPYFTVYYQSEYSPGYAWVFSRGIETSIGVCGRGDLVRKLTIFLRTMNIDPEEKKSIQFGFIPNQSSPVHISLPDALFTGDAGGFNFPLSMGGVHGALLSGKIAGEILRGAVINDNPEILRSYDEKMAFHPSRAKITHFFSSEFLSMKNESYNAVGIVKHEQAVFTIPFVKSALLLLKRFSLLAAKGLLIGLLAQQVVRRYRKYIF